MPCFIVFCFIVLHKYCIYLFLQIEDKILHQQKDDDTFYSNALLYCGGLKPNLQYLRDIAHICLRVLLKTIEQAAGN